ncbi:MAG: hypothetical protein DRR42_08905 [Gammaproteobacteria bacterium]|nr:MAG: hypothetical protein DRR42_08905 [Gammaproteobacteria bacterium]
MRLVESSRRSTQESVPRKYIENLIATLLGFTESHVSALDTPLAALSADELQKIVLLFASHELFEDRFQPQKAPFKSDIDTATRIVDTAEVIFGNWPKSFREHIHGIFTKNSRSLKREIGYLYEAVHTELSGSQFIAIRNEFDGSLRDAWPEPVLNDRSHLKLLPAMSPKMESGTLFCKRNKVKLESVISWIDSGILAGNVRVLLSGCRQVSLSCGQSLPEQSKPLEILLNLMEASARLGVSKRCMRALVEKGLFAAARDPATRVWKISGQAISDTLSNVSSAISTGDLKDGLDIYAAVRYFLPSTHRMEHLVEAIFNREIEYTTVRNSGNVSMVDVRIGKTHLKQWVIGDDALSITEFAEARHLNQEFAYQIVRKGLVKVEQMGRYGALIFPDAATDFDQKYLTASALLSETSFKRTIELVSFLSERGVRPVMGPTIDGSRQYLYRNMDIESVFSLRS